MILCPICYKIIGKIQEDGELKKAYLLCRRCKKEIYIDNVKDFNTKPNMKDNSKK